MTNTPKLAIAIGYIDDDLVTGAAEYMPKKNKTSAKQSISLELSSTKRI